MSELDTKILKKLLMNGRIGSEELARLCETSKNKVWKRCRAIERKGIIKGATTQINFQDFGFAALATLLISVEAQKIEEIMEYLEKITEIHAYRQYNSVYNIRVFANLRDLNELDHVKQIIRIKLPTISLKTYIWTGVRNIPENLNLWITHSNINEGFKNYSVAVKPDYKIAIDDVDMQILQKLTLDGGMTFTEMGKEIGVSTNTVLKRYRKLVENGSIKVSIQIDPKKIGYASIIDFNIAFTTHLEFSDDIVESLAKIPDIIIITKTSGEYDLQLTAMVRDIDESFLIEDKIARVKGVQKIESSLRKIPDRWPTPQQHISTM
jgi:Lrp/AsnC family transcriptional regulator for asnA, asnC and gidA